MIESGLLVSTSRPDSIIEENLYGIQEHGISAGPSIPRNTIDSMPGVKQLRVWSAGISVLRSCLRRATSCERRAEPPSRSTAPAKPISWAKAIPARWRAVYQIPARIAVTARGPHRCWAPGPTSTSISPDWPPAGHKAVCPQSAKSTRCTDALQGVARNGSMKCSGLENWPAWIDNCAVFVSKMLPQLAAAPHIATGYRTDRELPLRPIEASSP